MQHQRTTEPFAVASLYLHAEVLGGRRLTLQLDALEGDGQWTASLLVDPNTCSLNEFGDRAGCTRIAVARHPIRLTRQRVDDPAGHDRKLYAVEGAPTDETCHVVADRSWKHFRLVIGGHTVVALEPVEV